MKPYTFKTISKSFLADTLTPVSAYLKLRDQFPHAILLESSDYHSASNSFSYICFDAAASISIKADVVTIHWPDGKQENITLDKPTEAMEHLARFVAGFEVEKTNFPFISQGLFGYMAYDAVRYFESVAIADKQGSGIPDVHYSFYRNILAIDHFHNQAHLMCHSQDASNNLEHVLELLNRAGVAEFPFQTKGEKTSNLTDEDFLNMVALAQKHCQRGDVFQLVLSRQFAQRFTGDEFQVYRALRSINPSPYLFYFDYGTFKLMGSSPEAHLVVRDNRMEIHPIAGTFKRTGNDPEDAAQAQRLTQDPKENAEHVMLVDLARNDLSRSGSNVQVETFAELQFFSHVIHLVSKVTAQLKKGSSTLSAVAGTFPAGTLSGAPKHRAMQLIESIEPTARGFYGGAIGFMDFDGNFNHAILIRSFLSKDYTLRYQAGAGITVQSAAQNELQEVYHKLAALDKAIGIAAQQAQL